MMKFETDLENVSLKEIKDNCIEHQRNVRDCETCKFFRFCNYQMVLGYPSGWKLKGDTNVEGD